MIYVLYIIYVIILYIEHFFLLKKYRSLCNNIVAFIFVHQKTVFVIILVP